MATTSPLELEARIRRAYALFSAQAPGEPIRACLPLEEDDHAPPPAAAPPPADA